jgi:hypothetical protein
MPISTPPPLPKAPRPTRAQLAAKKALSLTQAHAIRSKQTYARVNREVWGGKAAPADVLAALGTNAANVLAYASQLGTALDQQLPGTTAQIPVTAQIKPVTIAADGTATLAAA